MTKAKVTAVPTRMDGYVNLINRWGTAQDSSEAYRFQPEQAVTDRELTTLYTDNGLFTKIIDAPAEEALKHGIDLGLNNPDVEGFVRRSLEALDWDEKAAAAIKWSRLYGGSMIVMLIDDGRGLDEPLNWKNIRSIDELYVFERPIVWPDYGSFYQTDFAGRKKRRGLQLMKPEFYSVSSIYGSFRVYESRCLIFRNGVLPESVSNEDYRFWGSPEYIRIKRALQDAVTAHRNGPKLLEKSIQAIYKMKGLASLLATEAGEAQALKRLQLIDMARNILNTIAIDSEGEEYDFKTFQLTGVVDIINSTCNMLSALTNIPQTVLFGRSPAGENATGESDMENWYSFVERIQKLSLKPNLHALPDVLFTVGVSSGKIENVPDYELKFNPLWSLSDAEQSAAKKTVADTAYVKAQTAKMYVDMQALDPSEVRSALAKDETFEVEDILDDLSEDELFEEQQSSDTFLPGVNQDAFDAPDTNKGVGVLVIRGGKILVGLRSDDGTFCGPGGHIKDGELPERAAIRETQEEFRSTPTELIYISDLETSGAGFSPSTVFLCTEYEGRAQTDGVEMQFAQFMEPAQITALADAGVAYPPFAESVKILLEKLTSDTDRSIMESGKIVLDGGPGSGNHGHEGIPGQVGGSAPSDGSASETTVSSATGANKFAAGSSPRNLDAHWEGSSRAHSHKEEYPDFSKEQYAERALELIQKPVAGNVFGYKTANGEICRYDEETNDYVKGHPDKGIKTMFKPRNGKQYYEGRKSAEGEEDE